MCENGIRSALDSMRKGLTERKNELVDNDKVAKYVQEKIDAAIGT